jgi:glycosyltransferase involved in cell wall biosynthesis
LALWGHGRTYTKRNTQLEERLKSKLVNRSDWFFGYTTNGVSSVVQNGFPAEKTTVVQNSTNTRELKRLADLTLESEIESLKRKFMVGNGPIGVFIGELDPSKRIDFLIRCSIKIQQHCPSFQLLIFGSGIELDRVLEACRDYPFIKYCGRAEQRTQVIIAKIATFILMPGRVGLIAVDSLELGLPILTTNWSWHAPEAEYLTPGVNSEFFNDDLNDYCSGVLQLISDDNRLNLLRKGCTDSAAAYSTEIMAQNFHDGVKKILDEPEHRLYRVRKTIRDLL